MPDTWHSQQSGADHEIHINLWNQLEFSADKCPPLLSPFCSIRLTKHMLQQSVHCAIRSSRALGNSRFGCVAPLPLPQSLSAFMSKVQTKLWIRKSVSNSKSSAPSGHILQFRRRRRDKFWGRATSKGMERQEFELMWMEKIEMNTSPSPSRTWS